MQGKKEYQEKLFTDFRLSDRIPEENFYRRLKPHNLKKYFKFINKTSISMAGVVSQAKKGLTSAFLDVKMAGMGQNRLFSGAI